MSQDRASYFLGVHVGRGSLRARVLAGDGQPVGLVEKRFRHSGNLPQALDAAFAELSQRPGWSGLRGAVVGLDKGQRCGLPAPTLQAALPEGVPLLAVPAQLAILLGAVPGGPSLLVSMGSDLRLAALDSTHTYREFRLQEGGGQWWTGELRRLAEHSPKLTRALSGMTEEGQVMKALPRLLEGADFPAPDPVLKVRMDGLCTTIAESCMGLASRLPGVRTFSMAGFLHPSPMSQRIGDACSRALAFQQPRFPAEVGAALLGLALHRENEERRHLGKPLEDGKMAPGQWGAPPLLIRRLFRTRRPFDGFSAVTVR